MFNHTDHLGNIRLRYSDLNDNGVIDANEILEENNYYPFGLRHEGYNTNVHGLSNQYKFNHREWQHELNLNVTAMDFRQYDNALGRFYNIDRLTELAPGITPYRFAFNNPNYWSDPTGLFESKNAAMAHISQYGLTGATVSYNESRGFWEIENMGYTFWQTSGGNMMLAYSSSDGVNFVNLGSGGSGGSSGGYSSGSGSGYAPSFSNVLSFGLGMGELTRQGVSFSQYGTSAGHLDKLLKQGKYIHHGEVYWQGNYRGVTNSMKNSLSGAKFMQNVGQKLTVTSALVTVVDGGINGWQNHHTADLVVTGALYFLAVSNPLGWIVGGVYTLTDLAVQAHTGKSITENLFD